MTVDDTIEGLASVIQEAIINDSSVPRNIRSNVDKALSEYLLNKNDDVDMRIYSTLSIFEEQTGDPNLPQHVRTKFFEFINTLESIVQKYKN